MRDWNEKPPEVSEPSLEGCGGDWGGGGEWGEGGWSGVSGPLYTHHLAAGSLLSTASTLAVLQLHLPMSQPRRAQQQPYRLTINLV